MNGFQIEFASIERILDWQSFTAFVWPDEGKFGPRGGWKFNAAHGGGQHEQDEDLLGPEFAEECGLIKYEPLFIDLTTANMLKTVYRALEKQENKDKFARMIAKDRGSFGYLVEKSWEIVSRRAA